eukprot:264610-Hanusia_phi.AAC.1
MSGMPGCPTPPGPARLLTSLWPRDFIRDRAVRRASRTVTVSESSWHRDCSTVQCFTSSSRSLVSVTHWPVTVGAGPAAVPPASLRLSATAA